MNEKYIVSPNVTVKQAIEQMEKELIKAVIITDQENRVLGLFTNGDMRSFFLRGGMLSTNICEAMNPNPKLFFSEQDAVKEHELFTRVIYPIVDHSGKLLNILDFETPHEEKISNALENVPLVIMAGGKGTRLHPYTKILPKPLIPIGDMTITERIIHSFQRYGCKNIIMVLNYQANMIKAYVNELEKDYQISCVQETQFLGTAGGLKLVRNLLDSTFILSNCDVLLNADMECIYRTHKQKQNKITVVCSMKDIVIPYGVVETDTTGAIVAMQEKPSFSFLVNTGIYMIEPEVIDTIADNEVIHLPDLAQKYLNNGEKVGVFPVSEKAWMDMGQFSEMENMLKQLGIR